jgi:hypothetical protein
VALVTMLTSPVLIVWEVNVLVVMSLGVLPYLLLWLVQFAFFGFGDNPTSGTEPPPSTMPAPTSAVVSSG